MSEKKKSKIFKSRPRKKVYECLRGEELKKRKKKKKIVRNEIVMKTVGGAKFGPLQWA